jgi:hypothetical protein
VSGGSPTGVAWQPRLDVLHSRKSTPPRNRSHGQRPDSARARAVEPGSTCAPPWPHDEVADLAAAVRHIVGISASGGLPFDWLTLGEVDGRLGADVNTAAARANAGGWIVRAYQEAAILTADYRPNRVNLLVDDRGRVTRAGVG